MRWNVEAAPGVAEEIEDLAPGLQARMLRLFDLIETLGPDRLHEPHAKHLVGKLWELRVKSDEGDAVSKIEDGPWPAFPADLTSIALAMATQAEGLILARLQNVKRQPFGAARPDARQLLEL